MRGGYYHGPPSYHDGRGMDRGPLRRSRSRSLGRYSPGRCASSKLTSYHMLNLIEGDVASQETQLCSTDHS